jgi:hypothetical protein
VDPLSPSEDERCGGVGSQGGWIDRCAGYGCRRWGSEYGR